MRLIEIQKALASKGFNPGPLDGVWGRQTLAAVRKFQASKKLEVDGIVGPQTLKALFPDLADPPLGLAGTGDVGLVWFAEAKRLLGLREKVGPGSNPEILKLAGDLGIDYPDDDIPWCGLFVAHCIGSTLDRESLPPAPLGARNWLKFGNACQPTLGAVMVFWRESRSSFKGHVGFYGGEDAHSYLILGGNQGDRVSWVKIDKARLLEARWPSSVSPRPGAMAVADLGTVNRSWNEA
ncbi:NlpC/P60 family protein [Frigidibacter sp. MR17.24]|uniref:NlpC/P60 family protein n=1 Tax=Frigidibacter sp. MR17.24 TaxID=3127345 RepID=UPI003012A013